MAKKRKRHVLLIMIAPMLHRLAHSGRVSSRAREATMAKPKLLKPKKLKTLKLKKPKKLGAALGATMRNLAQRGVIKLPSAKRSAKRGSDVALTAPRGGVGKGMAGM